MELTGAMFSTNSQVENMILKQVEKLMGHTTFAALVGRAGLFVLNA